LFYTGHAALGFAHSDARAALNRVLRTPLLDSRIVNRRGEVLKRPLEPLRWSVNNAANENEDYQFVLVTAEGAPVPPILCVLAGKPTLYVTEEAVFAGPAESVLEPGRENRIPAPAIERAAGVGFFHAMGLPLPSRVAERVRMVPLQVNIQCELKVPYLGSRTEECHVRITAEAPDGHKEVWTGMAWLCVNEAGTSKRRAEKDTI